MKKQELISLIQECFTEVITEKKKDSTEKKEAPKKESPKKEEPVKHTPKKSKGDAVSKPKPHEKAFADMTTNLTKKHGKFKAKELLSKKVKSLDENVTESSYTATIDIQCPELPHEENSKHSMLSSLIKTNMERIFQKVYNSPVQVNMIIDGKPYNI